MDGHHHGKRMEPPVMWGHGTLLPGGHAAKCCIVGSVSPHRNKNQQTKNPKLVGYNEPMDDCKYFYSFFVGGFCWVFFKIQNKQLVFINRFSACSKYIGTSFKC